jgi:double zinc ribbon protein
MKCSGCGFENAAGIKFCGECGAPMKLNCPSCGFANAPGIKFCGECGKPLTEAAKEPPPREPRSYTPKHLVEKILTSRSALEGERKQVTVLFADLKGSMDLAERLRPAQGLRRRSRRGLGPAPRVDPARRRDAGHGIESGRSGRPLPGLSPCRAATRVPCHGGGGSSPRTGRSSPRRRSDWV